MSEPLAILFDLDGTLVDTAPDLTAALNHTMASLNLPLVPEADVRHMVGFGARRLIEQGIEAAGITFDDGEIEAALAIFLDWYRDHLADSSTPFPGVVAMLDHFKHQGANMAVCTNKPQLMSDKLLEELGLHPYFSAVVGADAVTNRKPHADHIDATLAAMKASASRAIMVGDSMTDVNAARNAGIPVVAVSFGYTAVPPSELGADRLIDHMDDLPAAIEAVMGSTA